MTSIIEAELMRNCLYEAIIDDVVLIGLRGKNHILSTSECCSLVLRHVFNQVAQLPAIYSGDPVFIVLPSATISQQLAGDFAYFAIDNYNAAQFYAMLNTRFAAAAHAMAITPIKADTSLTVSRSTITYCCQSYTNISGLARNSTDIKSHYALALGIRYTYLRLETQGLANDYSKSYRPSNNVLEGFASAFNHYFDDYCSAFPDLEAVFGSRGSFYNMSVRFTQPIVMVNPPFDVQVMISAIDIVLKACASCTTTTIFMLTLPVWRDLPAIMNLKNTPYTRRFTVVPKHKTNFIDYMNGGKRIKPCAIVQVELVGGPVRSQWASPPLKNNK